mmetsp:Transcript_15592/g.47051  ORF Transcript_15592/g.47051 Transcript_15592/m.47051 type:complete len:161 (-) Transcript_15592:333-815(-)
MCLLALCRLHPIHPRPTEQPHSPSVLQHKSIALMSAEPPAASSPCSKQQASLALYLAKRKPVSFPKRNVFELTGGKDSDPHKMAGALAARVREQKAVCLTGIGEEAVARCIRAICHGRLYLEEDKVDIKALVTFVTVEKNDDSLNAVRFNIIVESVVDSI